MNVFGTMIVVFVCFATIIGFIVGLVKGFSRVKSWGAEYLLATFLTIGLSSAIGGAFPANDKSALGTYGVVTLILGVLFLLLFALTSAIFRKVFNSSRKRKTARDGKERGASGFMDRIFGAVTLAAKGFVIAGALSAFLLVVIDLAQIAPLTQAMEDIYSNPSWTGFKPLLMDFIYMSVILAAIRSGFNSGISNTLWLFVVIGMVATTAFISYNLAFNVEAFGSAASSLGGIVNVGGIDEAMRLTAGKCILTGILFILMLVAVVLIAIFVPKFLHSARNGSTFFAIDGIFGAVFATVLVVGVLLFFGSLVQPISNGEEFAFMAKFSSYFESSKFATFFYDKDILSMYGVQSLLPVEEWFAPVG